MGSFWTRSQVANNNWIDLNHVFSSVTSEGCRCILALECGFLLIQWVILVLKDGSGQFKTMQITDSFCIQPGRNVCWNYEWKVSISLTWKKIEFFKQSRFTKWKKEKILFRGYILKQEKHKHLQKWDDHRILLDLWGRCAGPEFRLACWWYSL